MELKIIKEEKDDIEIQMDSVTLAEILRVYLNKDSNVSFVAWKREHPSKNPVLKIKAKNSKKAVKDAVSAITKDLEKIEKDFKGMK